MKRIASLLITVAAAALLFASAPPTSRQSGEGVSPIYGLTIPAGYRDWKLISVGRLGGSNKDLRAKLGNDIAIKVTGRVRYLFRTEQSLPGSPGMR